MYSKLVNEINEEIYSKLQKIIKINNDILNQSISLINQNFSLYNNSLSLDIVKKAKELPIFQRQIDFVIQKIINFSIIASNDNQNELKNIVNVPQSNPINKEIITSEKFIDEDYNLYPIKSKNTQIISSTNNNHDIKFKCICTKKNKNNFISFEKHICDLQNNNEIKVLKNNKVVYINKDLINSYSISRGVKKLKKINFIIRKNRSSKYRGVSKNGNKWQVLMMINNKKYYLGNYPSEDLAARIYDIQAIKSWGIKARTNFFYNNYQIKKIYNKKINIKCNDISDILAQLNN